MWCVWDIEKQRTVYLPIQIENVPFDDDPEKLWTGDIYSVYNPETCGLKYCNYGEGIVTDRIGSRPQKYRRTNLSCELVTEGDDHQDEK
jgi:hypothetical protein